SGLAARTRTHRSVLTAPGLEKEQVSREWAARRLARAGIMANLGSEAEREPLLGPGSPESRFFYCDNVHLAISSKEGSWCGICFAGESGLHKKWCQNLG
ncbi:mCG145536, partial [Mus musculus]